MNVMLLIFWICYKFWVINCFFNRIDHRINGTERARNYCGGAIDIMPNKISLVMVAITLDDIGKKKFT